MVRRVIKRRARARPEMALALVLAAGLAGSCTNPDAFIGAAQSEVKSALNLFLLVSQVSPSKDAASVNPSSPIRIDFDRGLDTATVLPANISLAPSSTPGQKADWTYAYDTALKRLTITPAYLEGGVDYLMTLGEGLRGSGGESLKESYVWSFSTAALPGGTITINGGVQFLNSLTVGTAALNLSVNGLVDKYYYSEVSFTSADAGSHGWDTLPPGFPKSQSITLAGEGVHTIFYQFKSTDDALSDVLNTSVMVDTVAPNAPSLAAPTSPSATHYPAWSWISGGNGGFGVYQYYLGGWSDETSATGYSPAAGLADASYTFYVKERDEAGNWSSTASAALTVAAPPNAPTLSGTASPSIDSMPTWSWTSGGFGNGSYRFQLDSTSGAWTSTTGTSFTPVTALTDASHALYVQERDAGAEWSASGSRAIVVTPVIPYDGQTKVSRSPSFSWRSVASSYTLQLADTRGGWITVATGITRNAYRYDGVLAALTDVTWRVAYGSGKLTYYLPSDTGAKFKTTK